MYDVEGICSKLIAKMNDGTNLESWDIGSEIRYEAGGVCNTLNAECGSCVRSLNSRIFLQEIVIFQSLQINIYTFARNNMTA